MSKIRKEEMIMLKKKYYIGLDQGTTGTTTLLLDEKWNVVARGYKEHKQYQQQKAPSGARSKKETS